MTELVRYEAAKRALAEAVAVDEVKQIVDKAEALRQASRIAGDRDLEIKAAQLRFRAERRLGELIKAAKAAGQVSRGQPPKNPSQSEGFSRVTLKEAKIDHKLSSRAQRVAELPAERFENLLEKHAGEMRAGAARVAMDLLKVNSDAEGREARRGLAIALSQASASLPSGKQYPVVYADPPWHRDQGVTSRSYENHYPTMPWAEICAMPVKDLVLPDAWLFLWIPRAHAFALHEIELEAPTCEAGELVRVKVQMPLAWAVAQAWGFDAYSTAFVWTKTDEDHPDEGGGAILVRDQDELLLMFKRGNGLPKPEKKFGSNHRERSRPLGHSTKPQFYRDMIAEMAGRGVPCLELFARFDKDRPAPEGWDLWGNQATDQVVDEGSAAPSIPQRPESAADAAATAPRADSPLDQVADELAGDGPIDGHVDIIDQAELETPPLEISEYEALKALGDFCHPRRSEICAAIGADYAAKGFAVMQGGTNAWILREEGRARLNELDGLTIPEFLLRKRPQLELSLVVPPEVEIVDGNVQTRLPLNDDELGELEALQAITRGEKPDWHVVRGLIGKLWVHCPTSGALRLTEAGQAALASFVDVSPLEARA